MRFPVAAVLFLCALLPTLAWAMIQWRESHPPAGGGLDWPVWSIGQEPRIYIIDPLEVCAATVFVATAWFFERHIWRYPADRIFWHLWLPLFLSGMALVLMGKLHTGFPAIVGLALIARAFDWKRHRGFARKVRGRPAGR